MCELKKYLEKRLEHALLMYEKYKGRYGDNPAEHFTFHGGYDLGYWEGKVMTYIEAMMYIDGATKE